MSVIGRGPSTAARVLTRDSARPDTSLSVCCLTSGRRPSLLVAVLAPFRDVADEIVVAVEEPRTDAVRTAVEGVADVVLSFSPVQPADRAIAWLFGACTGGWIFNVDDDEVASPGLVAALPELVARDDVTHAWIARRWLYPTADTYVASAPWSMDYQLRLVLADDRFLQFSDVFHRPVICHGPSTFVDAPLWHLDTLLNPAAHRRRKAAAYERERPGMRMAGVAHNLGLYVPELHPHLDLAPVPTRDRAAIAAALAKPPAAPGGVDTKLIGVPADAVDREWVGAPFPPDLHEARLELAAYPRSFPAATQVTVDIRVTNRSSRTWRWGKDARPPLFLAYSWRREGAAVDDSAALRTVFPVDLAPGATAVVPVHVVAPVAAGRYDLLVDLVHEDVGHFGGAVAAEIEVQPRRRLAVIAAPERMADLAQQLALPPEVELVTLLRDEVDSSRYGDYATVVGPRPYLLAGSDGCGRIRTLLRMLLRTSVIARRSTDHWQRVEYRALLELRRDCDGLVVDGPNWAPDAAYGREWSWVAATAVLWQLDGKPVVVLEHAFPTGASLRARAVRLMLRALAIRT